jgi:hypothetical protein
MLRIEEILAAMPVHVPKRERHSRPKTEVTTEGPLDEVLSSLTDALADDYAEKLEPISKSPKEDDEAS